MNLLCFYELTLAIDNYFGAWEQRVITQLKQLECIFMKSLKV